MAIANPRIHAICGICGSNKMFEYHISEEIDDDTEETYNEVYISCKNCGSLTGLSELMPEEEQTDILEVGQILVNEETLEYGLLQHIKMCLGCNNESQAIRLLEKYGFEKQEEMYSEEDMEAAYNAEVQGWYEFDYFIKNYKKK